MVDKISAAARSDNMRRIRSAHTKPEVLVRSLLREAGTPFRASGAKLPGRPDFVNRKLSRAIFVHGCFWHQHAKKTCPDGRAPKSNQGYWLQKLQRNVARDRLSLAKLRKMGWGVMVIWECELGEVASVSRKLKKFLES